ncbi:MAG: TonB-dependent receptor [Cyanobacteria bacterium]|nr:TonB-dependent receptor [Cyanobacteriota bacterium]
MTNVVFLMMLLAQLQLGEIRGTVVDATGAVLPQTAVELTDPLGGVRAATHADDQGRFTFTGLAPGRYAIKASLSGFAVAQRSLTIVNAIPVDLKVRMDVSVEGDLWVVESGPPMPAITASVGGETIARVPVRNPAKGLQEIVATLPGWSTEDNGLLHVRGIDDGFLYVVDGVPVYERLDQLSGIAPDVAAVESINVMTGYVPAEFGYKAGGVIDIRSRSARSDWRGSTSIDSGSERTGAVSAAIGGPMSRRFAAMVMAGGQRSDRFLDPVHPDNLHNSGDARSVAGNFAWTVSGDAVLIVNAGTGRSDYDVPNTEHQQASNQNQRQRVEQWFGTINSQHAWSLPVYSQFAAYVRGSRADLAGSEFDTPLFANANRTLERAGALASTTWHAGDHMIKGGVDVQRLALRESFHFAVTDRGEAREAGFSRAAVGFDRLRPFTFAGEANPTLFAVYMQDDWQATNALTINGGVRVDRTALLLPRTQVSPRAGFTYRVADRTALRGSISRFFQPPQPEYLLLSSSTEARVLSPFAGDGEGGADIEPETQWAFDGGIEHHFMQGVRLDLAVWRRSIVNAADPNVFAGTTIIFPNAVATGRAYGADLRVEVRRWPDWSAYANLAAGRVRQRGPITGGLFLEDEIEEIADGEEFIPDHDQAIVASAGFTWTHRSSKASLAFVVRHESGTPLETGDDDDLLGRPGAELVDFKRGRVKPRTIASLQAQLPIWKHRRFWSGVQLSVHNIFDARYAYNFGNPFSGTHFGAPRTFSIGIRAHF